MERLHLNGVTIVGLDVEIPPFSVDALLGRRGELVKALLDVEKARVVVTPKDKVWQVELNASGWKPFVGPAIEFDELQASGIVDSQQATFSDIKGQVAGGTLTAQLKAGWGSAIQGSGNFKLENAKIATLLPAFTRNFNASGMLRLNANYSLTADNLRTLFNGVHMEGGFAVTGGELNNIDIVRAMQANRATGQRGGKTRFENLTGTLQVSGNQYSFRQLHLNSGPMSAVGAIDVRGGALSGQINAELGSKTGVVARAALTAEGKLSDPVLR
jgi:hypothetical protein